MSSDASWDHFATFLAVMHGGSLSAAARRLGLTQPTVRRQIEELERQLGVTLFTRSPNGLVPTPAAYTILPHAEAMRSAADALARATTGDAHDVAGTIRVTCSEVIAAEVLPAILKPLLAEHRRLAIEVAATDLTEDLLRRDADVAIRMVAPKQDALVAKRVADVALGLYAARDYLAGQPAPGSVRDLENGHAIVAGDRLDQLVPALTAAGVDPARLRVAVRSDNSLVQLAAVRNGVGIGVCQRPVAARDASLMPVCPDVALTLPVWVVMHEDLRAEPRARAVFDCLVAGLG